LPSVVPGLAVCLGADAAHEPAARLPIGSRAAGVCAVVRGQPALLT
jgi:hypothetical protein